MGKKKKALKVVLDTNVIVSALLFKGVLSKLCDLWKKGKINPIISNETYAELRTVLEYPKFSLSKNEINELVEDEILPYFDVQEITRNVQGVCKDPDDDKFLSCAMSASADFIVSGDKRVLNLEKYKSIKIIKPSELIKKF